ncbi:MAG: efflux RND transporter permease subunit [Geminicoccaceae bacterium]
MNRLIDASFQRSRTVFVALLLILVAGATVYRTIPKEADPDIQIPTVYVSMHHEGISPEDAERLLVRPMETELRGIEGVKEIRSVASEGHASVTLEFDAEIDIDEAVADVRESVDIAKAELPDDTDEPTVNEVNLALFPVVVVTLSGPVPERTLLAIADGLKDRIESLTNVLEVDIAGDREELLEVVIDPIKVEAYDLKAEDIFNIVQRNNRLVAAGALDTGQGRFAIKVPGVFETARDVMRLPIRSEGDVVVVLEDLATIRRTFKDPVTFARVDGQPALALEVSKRIGTNIIETIEQVRAVVEAEQPFWPEQIEVGFSQDKSDDIENMLSDLQNNVLSAIILVMIVVVAALGLRSALLVGFAVPGSFLTGIMVLGVMGLTVNIVVLFALILAVGMLVDGAIVVTELADRKMAEGLSKLDAYRHAAKRMAWPITASTATTLAAFMPLLFWPGIVGEFMKYLPITLLATLAASLAMALIFVPNVGALIGKPETTDPATMKALSADRHGDLNQLGGIAGAYVQFLRRALKLSIGVPIIALVIAIMVFMAYGTFGRGVEFFPDVEPEQAQLQVHARGDLSIWERSALVREVEERILGIDGIDRFYSTTAINMNQGGGDMDDDVIGVISMEFADWRTRRPARAILAEALQRTDDLAGIRIEARREEAGPPVGKDVQIQIASRDPTLLSPVMDRLDEKFRSMDGLENISDSRPIPGIEWEIRVDREAAQRFAADISVVGSSVQLVTNGLQAGTYRPDDADDEVDIRVRYPLDERSLDALDRLRISTDAGTVPLGNFIERQPALKVTNLERVDGKRVLTIGADVAEGVLADDKVRELRTWLADQTFPAGVEATFKGEDEEQQEAQAFLSKAFAVALFLIAMILVTQFNSFYQSALILSAIIFSVVGVLLGLLITNQPFGIVMSGVGVIALAGIVVNNNIVLIDTYNDLRRRGLEPMEAVLRTGAQRLRPVLLTTITTILGLLPMVLKLNVNLFTREITVGGPSTDWWAQLASAVAGGLAFATLLTLVLTPCLLYLPTGLRETWRSWRGRDAAVAEPTPTPGPRPVPLPDAAD